MKKYQIIETTENLNHAGSKATKDIAEIAQSLGYQGLNVRMRTTSTSKLAKIQRQAGYLKDWKYCEREIEKDSVILLQHPFHYPQMTREHVLWKLKEEKHVRFICLVHDVEQLRGFRYNDYYKQEFNFMLRIADVLIVHNTHMKDFFLGCGIAEEKLVDLEIFDYLQSGEAAARPVFERSLTVAGNLDTTKCRYIGELGELDGVCVKLYGPNFDHKLRSRENIQYYGSFPADEIPSKLTGGFGLVWDGESIRGCKGQSGQYLKYNNPHKLSLYLSSGLPVVIWKGAAEADFVQKHNAGVCVDSLTDLTELFAALDEKQYQDYAEAVGEMAMKLRSGYYGRKAILASEKILNI